MGVSVRKVPAPTPSRWEGRTGSRWRHLPSISRRRVFPCLFSSDPNAVELDGSVENRSPRIHHSSSPLLTFGRRRHLFDPFICHIYSTDCHIFLSHSHTTAVPVTDTRPQHASQSCEGVPLWRQGQDSLGITHGNLGSLSRSAPRDRRHRRRDGHHRQDSQNRQLPSEQRARAHGQRLVECCGPGKRTCPR